MKTIFVFGLILFSLTRLAAQELYPFAEPASNMPAKSIALKSMSMFHGDVHSNRLLQRHMPEIMFGLNKSWMVHAGSIFSNMHQPKFIWEGAKASVKYRFLSKDDVHKHFRMAVFAGGAYSRNHLDHNEINIPMGEQSGVQAGLIATQLWNRFALSATGSWNEIFSKERNTKLNASHYAFTSLNYSLSAGYLLFPLEYKDYDQTNINLYTEFIGSRNLNFKTDKFYLDLAPSIQAIFKSTSKLSFAYRFQVAGDIYRLTNNSFMLSYEHLILNALKRKKKN